MNDSISRLVKLIFLAVFPLALTACDVHYKYDPDNELNSEETNVLCNEILSELDKQALSNEHKPINDYFKSQITLANKKCPKTFKRDFSIAQFLALSGEIDSAIILLESIESNNQELDIKKLNLLFWIYNSTLDDLKATEIINQAETKYPNNSHTLMMVSVNKCSIGSCKDDLEQLIKADKEFHYIAALPFLAQAYAENNDFQNASLYFDKAISISGISIMADKTMYMAVLSNLNIQKDETAKTIYLAYTQAKPNVKSEYVQDAKAALDSLGLLSNEVK